MRLLQVSLRSYLFYSVLLVLIATPASFITIHHILQEEVDESLKSRATQFARHIKTFEYLDDLAVDMGVMDELSYDLDIKPVASFNDKYIYSTVSLYDSLDEEIKPFRELTTSVLVLNKPYRLSIRTSLVENEDLVFVIGMVMAALMILLTGGLFLINRSMSQKIWSPFYNTLHKLKAYELDKSEAFAYEESRIAEFDDLNNAIRSLTRKNKQVFQQQKDFIENASHELQTPLAIFQSKLDMLMQSQDLTEKQALLIQDMIATNQRIARLNKGLLLISKIENEQFLEKENVDMALLLHESIDNFLILTESSRISTQSDLHECIVHGNKMLLEILINNLMRNAYQHNIPGGQIIVVLQRHQLDISNSGETLKISTDQLFERFYKGKVSSGGTGLGLAIVKKICDLSGYTISYQYTEGMHHFSAIF